VAYGLCRLFGQRAFVWLAGEDGRRDAERLFAAAGGWLVAGSRWLPIFPETVACLAGLVAMDGRRFMVSLACGALPLGLTFAWIGHLGADAPLATLIASALVPLALWALLRPFIRRGSAA
jgi:membrane protein DedA with SNARE-associated domain